MGIDFCRSTDSPFSRSASVSKTSSTDSSIPGAILGQRKPPLHHDPCNPTILHAFNLGVLSVLGASLFPAPKSVRAKDAKLAKV